MSDHTEVDNIRRAIVGLEGQRQTLGDEVVDTALAPLRARLVSLHAGRDYEQRKRVTILFADLVGSTALSEQMDAEDMRELLHAYFRRCRTSVERHGGVVEKFIGDAVMAVFGLPIAKEDDAEQAVRAGLEIARVPEQLRSASSPVVPASLATRVGINTGEVVVGALGERLGGELVVVGDPVNVASRVQNEAPPGGVLITHDTYRHVRGVFDVEAMEPLRLKGVTGRVPAYLVGAARPRAHRMPRRGVEGVETRLVGRSAELARLRDAFRDAMRDQQRQVVTVVGDAGIGKSRLLEELETWLEGLPEKVICMKGRAHPTGQTSPYSLLRDLFALQLQIQDSDLPPVVRRKLEDGYAEAFPAATPDHGDEERLRGHARAAHVIGRLLGFGFGPSEHLGGAGSEARGLHDEALVHLRDYIDALGRRRPVVVVLEDLHWADDSSLDLLELLVEALETQPLLVVATARPSLFERHPGWPVRLRRVDRLQLGPLSPRDSAVLVDQILHRVQQPPPELAGLLVDAGEGNPFYMEELFKMLVDEGVVDASGDRWRVERDRLPTLHVPPTLAGVLQARFDSLPPEERAYLQRGSVIGRIFWDRATEFLGLATTPGGEPVRPSADVPDRLRAREMIFEREGSTFADTREFLFKHALLRDATYDTLLKRHRQALHLRAARWLEQVTQRSGRSGEFAAIIAAHYEQARDVESAAEWWFRAGTSAASRYANAEALHALNRALALSPGDDKVRQFEIRSSRAAVFGLQGKNDERVRELEAMRGLADALADPGLQASAALGAAAHALSVSDFATAISAAEEAGRFAGAGNPAVAAESELLQADALARQGSVGAARHHAEHALERARRCGLPRVEANSLRQLGMLEYFLANHQGARDRFAAALELFVSIGDKQGEGIALNNLGGVTSELGDHGQATVHYQRSLDLCREIGDRVGEARALNNLGILAVVQGDHALAEAHYLRSLEICRQVGQRSFEMSALDNLGNLALYRYQFSRAMAYQLDSLNGAREIGDRVTESYSLGNLARACLMIGDWQGAAGYISSGLELVRGIGDHQGQCDLLVRLSEYHCATGRTDAAVAAAQEALDLARRHDFQSETASALHALGGAALSAGDAYAALEHFRSALDMRRRLGQTAEACDSQAGLASARLSAGAVDQAVTDVDGLLHTLQDRGTLGLSQPVLVLLTAYRVLAAAHDPRAVGVLRDAYGLLQLCASNIDDVDLRRAFLDGVAAHRELAATWEGIGAGNGAPG